MGRRLAILAIVSMGAGCSSATNLIFELPKELEEVDTIIVIRETVSGFTAAAYPREDLPLPLVGSTDEVSAVRLLGYRTPLSALHFAAGLLTPATPKSCAQGRLPEPDVGFRFDLDKGERTDATEVPAPLRKVDFDQICPCLAFEHDPPKALGPYGRPQFIGALSGGSWLIATQWAVLELDEDLELVSTATVWRAEDFLQDGMVIRGPDEDRVLLVGLQGTVFDWTKSNGLQVLPAPPETEALTGVAGAPDGSEIFVLTIVGQVLSLDLRDGSWSELWTEPRVGDSDQGDAITWLRPGRVTVSPRRAEYLLELGFQGEPGFTKTDWTSNLDPTELLHHVDGLGLLLASGQLNVWLRTEDDQPWQRLNQEGEAVNTSRFLSYEEGFLQLSRSSFVQYHPRSSYCESFSLGVESALVLDGDLDRGWLVVANRPGSAGVADGQTEVVHIRGSVAD